MSRPRWKPHTKIAPQERILHADVCQLRGEIEVIEWVVIVTVGLQKGVGVVEQYCVCWIVAQKVGDVGQGGVVLMLCNPDLRSSRISG